ncbi:TetR family transcriptional regulator [Ornithinimicrobium faecis]|uniref:TetR family transcriptional regulator n=1 Tax=Ornithinimicrobium faecis TaxID=2934158 RepID=A0ABY4YS83_9MICO|nr:TetR family transcriptional regulator [Ornithinimicrobium sp. HY1793]USQ79218.1 TetR family transcriptional regulator [Ornithinimicrobium sp. HY1793]
MAEAADARSGATRILEAAINLFGQHGVRGTSLRSIAQEAEVSQALVIHHYGSKEGLRRACDHHVASVTRSNKETTVAEGPQLDPFVTLRRIQESRPLLRYLARALTEGGEATRDLVDEFVADAHDYMHLAEEAGFFKPSATPRERTIVLVIWSMGALAMHEHLDRLLGVDFLATDAPPESLGPYLRPMLELFTQGLMAEGAFDQMANLFDVPESFPTDAVQGDRPDGNPDTHPDTNPDIQEEE